jgi:predicted phosphodiesterase
MENVLSKSKLFEFGSDTHKIFVVGDLHGDFQSFQRVVEVWQKEPDAYIVFLGDYADRGEQGVEILESLIQLTENKHVIALKGNHESYSLNGKPRFSPCTLISEVEEKRGDWSDYYHGRLKPFFDSLYLAAMLPGKSLFVHGGISSRITDTNTLVNPPSQVEEDLIWSDPTEKNGEYCNTRGAGVIFGQDISTTVLGRIGVQRIIRSHDPRLALTGPYFSHEGKIMTISSTNVYGGKPFFLEIDYHLC